MPWSPRDPRRSDLWHVSRISPRSSSGPGGSEPRKPQPAAFQALPAPGRNPRPAGPRQTAAWRPARPVRKEEPARRPRRGCTYLARRRLRPGLQAPRSGIRAPDPPPPPSAPLAPAAAAPALATATFIFFNYIGPKAKAKIAERRARSRACGERGERAGRQQRGLGARAAGRRCSGWSPVHQRGWGWVGAGRPGGERTGLRASVCRDASPGPDCWSLFVGFWLGGWKQTSEGYQLEALSELGQVLLSESRGQPCSQAQAWALVPLSNGRTIASNSLILA